LTIVIAAPALRALLDGSRVPQLDGEVVCDGVRVGRVRGGRLVAVACAAPRHGVHPRFAGVVEALVARGVPMEALDSHCAICGGTGELSTSEETGAQLVAQALALGVFRGIPIPPQTKEIR
jgi:hypothetical protein